MRLIILIDLLDGGHLSLAGRTPAGPHVDDHRLAAQVGKTHLFSIKGREREVGRQEALTRGWNRAFGGAEWCSSTGIHPGS